MFSVGFDRGKSLINRFICEYHCHYTKEQKYKPAEVKQTTNKQRKYQTWFCGIYPWVEYYNTLELANKSSNLSLTSHYAQWHVGEGQRLKGRSLPEL